MVTSFREDFSVTWADPKDATANWLFDRLHYARPMPPLAQEYFEVLINWAYRKRTVFVNGYPFVNDYGAPAPSPEIVKRGAYAIWTEDFQPEIEETCQRLRSRDYAAQSTAELAGSLDDLFNELGSAYQHTLSVVLGFVAPVLHLAAFCEDELGPEGPGMATGLLQGFQNQSTAVGLGLDELTQLATARPGVSAALQAGRTQDLASVAGGDAFMARLATFLDTYGWRAEAWSTPHQATWAEDPSVPLALIGRYLAEPEHAPAVAIQRSATQREETVRRVEAALPSGKMPRFRKLLAECQRHVHMSEERAFWQLSVVGSVRIPVIELGHKLASAGAIDEPNDIFFLTSDEVRTAATTALPARYQTLVDERKALLAWQEGLTPPHYIGRPPADAATADSTLFRRYFLGYDVTESTSANVITGNGASRGVASGRARVVHTLEQAASVEDGDILVCPSTSPPWTPLFAIVGAVVTDVGGILSHSAICAREYAIPCVVGTRVGTASIPNGAMLTVDGTAGTVTIER